jgi:sulfofructosephosphate aldolase
MKRDLSRLARPSGALAMVAVDQREALRGMFAKHQSDPVLDAQLTQFKVDVARELSPYASGLLVDQEFGLDAIVDSQELSSTCGLIAAADLLIGPAGGAATDTAVDPAVDPHRMKSIGAAGLKFLVLWRNDESPESRMKLVNEFNALCDAVDLPSIIEVIVKAPHDPSKSWDREAELITAAREARNWGADLYKAEVPFHGEGDLKEITAASAAISEAIAWPLGCSLQWCQSRVLCRCSHGMCPRRSEWILSGSRGLGGYCLERQILIKLFVRFQCHALRS